MKEYQLKIDIFNINCPLVEEQVKTKIKQDNTAKVVLKNGFAKDIKVINENREEEKEEVIEIKF